MFGFKQVMDSDEAKGAFSIEGGNVYINCQNKSASALNVGEVVTYDVSNGLAYQVIKPTTATLDQVAGVVAESIAVDGFGKVMAFGTTTAYVSGGTDVTIGDSLKAVNGVFNVIKDQASGTAPSFKQHLRALAGYTTDASALVKVHVNCL